MLLNPLSPHSPHVNPLSPTATTIIPVNIPKRMLDTNALGFSFSIHPHLLGVGGREIRGEVLQHVVQEQEHVNLCGVDVRK